MTTLIRRNGIGAWDPWRMFEETEARLRDWMETPAGYTPVHRALDGSGAYVPPVDVYETENELFVFASVPGIKVETVDIKAQNGMVTVNGEQTPVLPEGQENNVRVHLAGIPRYGQFAFTLTLPVQVDWNSAEAQYQDGLLRICFRKPESAKPVRISLTSHESGSTIATEAQKRIEGTNTSARKK